MQAPVEAPAPAVAPAPVVPAMSVAGVTEALLEVVSEKTGYPVETLELEMDIEADLGIDSIKRVEILGAMRDRFPTAPTLRPAEMAELRTLQQIVNYLEAHNSTEEASSNGPSTNGAAANGAATNGAATNGANGAIGAIGAGHATAAPWTAIRLKRLPPADRMEIAPPAGSACVITDDGTPVTAATVGLLSSAGWRVAVLRLPGVPGVPAASQASHGPAGAAATVAAADASEEGLRAALGQVTAQVGPVGVLIHLSPTSGGPALFGETERASVRHAFLLAKVLQPALTGAGERGDGRAAFMAVTRLDGALGSGLNGSAHAFTAESGGLYGLVKTLRLEWPGVHCRAVDASPALTADEVAAHVLAEYLDPDGLVVEVGHGPAGRVTLAPAGDTAHAGSAH
jgi:acyl carrier protein